MTKARVKVWNVCRPARQHARRICVSSFSSLRQDEPSGWILDSPPWSNAG